MNISRIVASKTIAITALTVSALSSGVGIARAADNGGTYDGPNSCQIQAGDATWLYSGGDKITVTYKDGSKQTFVCDGKTGKWVLVGHSLPVPTIRPASSPAGSVSATAE